MMNVRCFDCNDYLEVCSILWDETGECVICDPGFTAAQESKILSHIESEKLRPVAVILTHGHFDHVLGAAPLSKKFGIKVYAGANEGQTLKNNRVLADVAGFPVPEPFEFVPLHDGDTVRFGKQILEVLETPGHTPGGVCYLNRAEKLLLSGDTLFQGSIGRSDLPGGNYDNLMESIFTKIMVLDGDIDVIPGHGPATSIADERQKNPFLLPFNEPYEEPGK